MISKMQKLLLVGPQKKKDGIIEKLQNAGVVEVMPYKGKEFATDGRFVTTAKADTALSALKLADKYNAAAANTSHKTNQVNLSAAEAADKIIELDATLKKIRDELALLGNKMKTVETLGDFSLADIRSIEEKGKIKIQIWETTKKAADEIDFSGVLAVFKIYSDSAKEIFLTCAKEHVTLRKCSEIVLEDDLESLKKAISGLTEKKNGTESAIFDLAAKRKELYDNYLTELDKISFNRAAKGTVSEFDNKVFLLQAWCPKSELANLKKIFENECAAIIEIEPEKDETIPTLIDSKKAVDEMGRDLVNIYDTPAYTDWDPSSWVFFSFTLFFAMIVGDGGYGLLLFAFMLFLKIKLKNPGSAMRRFINLLFIVKDVIEVLKEGRSPIILTSRTSHVSILAELLKPHCPNVITLIGSESTKDKRQKMEHLQSIPSSEQLVIVATGKYVGEGFDYARLDTLFLVSPVAWKGIVAQYAGRLHREFEGKQDVQIYDYIDIRFPICESMYRKRLKGYASIGYRIRNNEAFDSLFPITDVIYDGQSFESPFISDLSKAKQSVVVSCPKVKIGRHSQIADRLADLIANGIEIVLHTKEENTDSVATLPYLFS